MHTRFPEEAPIQGISPAQSFARGLVFGFDVGTGSIGWAVRRGAEFLDVGVLICPEDTNDLSGRRGLRRQRRTLRSKKYRRQWLAAELAKLSLPAPSVPPTDPITLRLRALRGEPLAPHELHAAIAHLFRRRGYAKVPWSNRETEREQNPEAKKEQEGIRKALGEIRQEMEASGCRYPAELLARRREQIGPSPARPWARKLYWPRELLKAEFAAIVAAQAGRFPRLAEAADWLLYGDTHEVRGHWVYFKHTEGRNPGVLGLRWPRFENRGPALDAFTPVAADGRPLHVVRRNKEAFHLAQWELAILNFRVLDVATGALVPPDPRALARLREMWESTRRKPRGRQAASNAVPAQHEIGEVKVSEALLKRWSKEFEGRYRLVDGQQPLTPQTGAGRARFASPTLERLREIIAGGARPDNAQPVLLRPGERAESALNRYLADIKHPLVRHRLVLFSRLLAKLAERFGQPDLIVLEAVRSLALSRKNKRELQNRIKANRDQRASIREELARCNASTSRKALLRYRLWKEAQSTCPFCGEKIRQDDLLGGGVDIEHLVPRAVVDCSEFYNLTVGHIRCNRDLKGDRTPWQAFAQTDQWPRLRDNAEKCFKGRKLELFLSEKAEELIEQKADLQHTAYIARVIRQVALLQLGWLGEDGRDPTTEKGNQPSSSFQVTNGQLTSRLRNAWGLNHLLHPLPHGVLFHELPEDQQKQFQEKNRGDLRHHALDAMVIACTLPWLAHRTVGATDPNTGERGWWRLDERTQRSLALNPVFPQEGALRDVAEEWMKKVIVRHHASRSNHQQGYNTRLYGQRQDAFVIREPLARLGPDDLPNLWPPELANYCSSAWRKFVSETPDLDGLLKRTKGCLPDAFTTRLCFSHFQSWREKGMAEFSWPVAVRVPLRRARVVGSKDRSGFLRVGTGFIERKSFREVRICRSADGLRFVPVFVPFHQHDTPTAAEPFDKETPPVAILRKGTLLTLRKALGPAAPPGRYILHELSRGTPMLLPPHVAGIGVPAAAFGLAKSGLKPRWNTLIKALGYELPHPPSAEPRPAGPDQTGPVAH